MKKVVNTREFRKNLAKYTNLGIEDIVFIRKKKSIIAVINADNLFRLGEKANLQARVLRGLLYYSLFCLLLFVIAAIVL